VVLHEIGMPSDLFSPSFAVSRMSGWCRLADASAPGVYGARAPIPRGFAAKS
jgi:hypothetical protein